MPKLRIVPDNALERASSFTASSTAGSLVAANLLNWRKSEVWRATGPSAAIKALFAEPEPIGCVALPFCNLSPTATMRVRVSTEGAATNLLRYSEQFDNAVWSKTRSTITANAILAPDGTMTGDKLCNNGVVDANGYVQQGFTADGASTHIGFAFAKAGEITTCQIDFIDSVGFVSGARTVVNLTTGAITASGSGGSECVPVGNGWYLIAVRGVPGASSASLRISLPADATAGTDGFYIWGADVKKEAKRSSYCPSVANPGVRPAGYMDAWQSYDYDSGWVPACPWPAAKLRGFTPAQAASAYAYGGGTYARHWLPAEVQARGLTVDIRDPDNLQGYIEAACMVAGPVWSPKYNASGAALTPLDTSENLVTGGGDTCGEPGFISREIPVDLSYMDQEDGLAVMDMALNSAVYPLLVSVRPDDPNPARERKFMAYATRSKSSAIGMKYAAGYTTSITFKEV